MKSYWMYILCSKRNGIIYREVVSNFARRVYENREQLLI